MILEVEEAGGFEGLEDGIGRLGFGRRIEQGREVDKLEWKIGVS